MSQMDVEIMGQSYRLGCPEGGDARLRDAVQKVDEAMCAIRDAGKVRARDRIAVLAALNLAFELGTCEEAGAQALLPGSDRQQTAPPGNAVAGGVASLAAETATGTQAAAALADPRLAGLLARLDAALAESMPQARP